MNPRLPLAAFAILYASAASAEGTVVTAELKDGKGQVVGKASLAEAPRGTLLRIEATGGLTPGWHGLHLHEKADCSRADFTSAGGHTHPGGERVHGLLNPKSNETGDLPNLYVGMQGDGAAEVFTTFTTLAGLRDADGSAVVIHASPDDHQTQPIGGAGARVACAEIR